MQHSLPDELLVQILLRCNPDTVLALRWSCTRWFSITTSDGFESLRFGLSSISALSDRERSRALRVMDLLVRTSRDTWENRLKVRNSVGFCVQHGQNILSGAIAPARFVNEEDDDDDYSTDSEPEEHDKEPTACRVGCEDLVRFLLTDAQVNPANDRQSALRQACAMGHARVISILLSDVRVDPSIESSFVVHKACVANALEAVRVLLADSRADPSAFANSALVSSAYLGLASIVDELLRDPRVNPAARDDEAIRFASFNGHTETVRALLQDGRVNPAALNFEAVSGAIIKSHTEILALLLSDERVRPPHDFLRKQLRQPKVQYGNPAIMRIVHSYIAAFPEDPL